MLRPLRSCLALGLSVFGCSGELPEDVSTEQTEPVYRSGAVSDGTIEAVFTEPGTDAVKAADTKLIESIDGASRSVEVASYMFSRLGVAQALVRAQERGLRVRFVGDADQATTEGYQTLSAAGIPIVLRPAGDYIMHDKFVVIDRSVVFTGSMNLTDNGAQRNNENFVRVSSPGLAEAYIAEFEQMAAGRFGPAKSVVSAARVHTVGSSQVEAQFGPKDDLLAKVRGEIAGAQKTIRFMMFEFGNLSIAQELIAAQGRGVEVVGLFDAERTSGSSSRDDLLATSGVPTYLDGNVASQGWSGGDLHHKVMIIDEGTPNARVVTGSFNWTTTAATKHDENLLILRGTEIARIYGAEFCRDYAVATLHPLSTRAPVSVCGTPAIPVINEIMANPDGTDKDEEWVEIVNPGSTSVDITGYQLRDGTSVRHVFGPTLLPAGGAVVVYSGGVGRHVASTAQLSLNNDADQVVLSRASGEIVDQASYATPVSGVSFNRAVDGDRTAPWSLHDRLASSKASPGKRLDGSLWAPPGAPVTPPPATGVIINEVLADPEGTDLGSEFVELVNTSAQPVDLSGWTLSDATAARHVFGSLLLPPGKAVVVFDRGDHSAVPGVVLASTQQLSLNNTGETVRLQNASGTLVDEVRMASSVSGTSANRNPDATSGAPMVAHDRVGTARQSPGLRATLATW